MTGLRFLLGLRFGLALSEGEERPSATETQHSSSNVVLPGAMASLCCLLSSLCSLWRVVDDTDSASNACKELAIFLTTGIVISAFGLPIVFARADVIAWGACALVLTGNVVIFATILGFFVVFGSNDDFSWQQW